MSVLRRTASFEYFAKAPCVVVVDVVCILNSITRMASSENLTKASRVVVVGGVCIFN